MIRVGKFLKPIFLIYFLFFFINGALESFYPMYLKKLDFSGKEIGAAFTIISLTQIFLPVLSSSLSNKFSPKRVVIIGILISALLTFFIFRLSSLICVIFLGVLIHLVRPLFNFSLGNSILVSINSEERGKYLSIRDLFLYGGMSLGIFLFSFYIKNRNINTVFKGWNFLYLFFIIYIILNFKDCKFANKNEKESVKFNEIFKEKNLLTMLILTVLLTFSYTSTIFVPILALKIGFKIDEFMKFQSLYIIINAVAAYKLADYFARRSKKYIYFIDLAIDTIPFTLLALNFNKTGFIFAFLILQLKDVFSPVSFSYKMDLFEERNITSVLGFLESVSNIIGLISPIILGYLWDLTGVNIFFISSLLAIAASVLVLCKLPD